MQQHYNSKWFSIDIRLYDVYNVTSTFTRSTCWRITFIRNFDLFINKQFKRHSLVGGEYNLMRKYYFNSNEIYNWSEIILIISINWYMLPQSFIEIYYNIQRLSLYWMWCILCGYISMLSICWMVRIFNIRIKKQNRFVVGCVNNNCFNMHKCSWNTDALATRKSTEEGFYWN